jgi:hypothetical protein
MSSSKKVSIAKKSKTSSTTINNEEMNTTSQLYDDEEYNKQVKHFFEIKNKWETRKNKKQTNCLICNNLTDTMIFEVSHDLYLAKCGKKTCPSIEISRRTYISIDEKMRQMREKLDVLKRKFIVEKMDTMFKFIDDKNAIKVFKNEFEEYRELLKVYNQYNVENKKEERQKRIDNINDKIFEECVEIKKLRELRKIDDIVDIVNNKISPLTSELQKITYPIMEINITKNGDIMLYQNTEIPQFIRV